MQIERTPTGMASRWRRAMSLVAAMALTVAACGYGDDASSETADETETTAESTGTDTEEAATEESDDDAEEAATGETTGENCVDEVVVGTVWPMSGTFSFVGEAEVAGASKAVADINAAGRIESLCGAQLRLATVDAGGTAEEAATAVERLLDNEGDISAIAGSWLSSFTLSATEVSERAGVPFVTESFADSVSWSPVSCSCS